MKLNRCDLELNIETSSVEFFMIRYLWHITILHTVRPYSMDRTNQWLQVRTAEKTNIVIWTIEHRDESILSSIYFLGWS